MEFRAFICICLHHHQQTHTHIHTFVASHLHLLRRFRGQRRRPSVFHSQISQCWWFWFTFHPHYSASIKDFISRCSRNFINCLFVDVKRAVHLLTSSSLFYSAEFICWREEHQNTTSKSIVVHVFVWNSLTLIGKARFSRKFESQMKFEIIRPSKQREIGCCDWEHIISTLSQKFNYFHNYSLIVRCLLSEVHECHEINGKGHENRHTRHENKQLFHFS